MRLKEIASRLRHEIEFYRRVYAHPETPRVAKILLWLALSYVAMPIDLIPDAIPLLGHLDDLVIVPLLIVLAMRCVPRHVYDECRAV